MIIRPANFDTDALAIIDGARAFAKFTGMNLFPTDDDEFVAAIGRIMTMEGFEILLAEHEDRIVGGIGILYGLFMWNPSILIAEERFWWAYKDSPFRTGKNLMDEAMKRIDEKGATPVFQLLENSPKGAEKIYQHYGLSCIGTIFMRVD